MTGMVLFVFITVFEKISLGLLNIEYIFYNLNMDFLLRKADVCGSLIENLLKEILSSYFSVKVP